MSTIDQIRNSLGKFYLATNPGYKYVPYQQEILAPALERLERREIRRLMIHLPPGHSKSDWATRRFVPWYMGRNPTHNAMVVSYSADLASDDFGDKIKNLMLSDLYLKIFPDAKLSRDSRGKTRFRTVSGGVFYSTGFTGSITGKRLNMLCGDDWISSFEEADSEATQNKIFNEYKGTIKDRMRPDGVVVICAHKWRPRDAYARILELEGTVEEGGRWHVLKLPAEDPPDSGNYLWEDYYGKDYYEDFKKDSEVWWSKFQQNPQGAQTRWFRDEDLQFYDGPIPTGKFRTYLLCDPGATKDRKSDRTSIQVFAAGQGQKAILADWVLDKFGPIERQTKLDQLIRKWTPEISLYEEYGLVSDTVYFNKASEDAGFNAVLTPVGKKGPRHNLSKEERIRGLKSWFQKSQIVLPRKHMYRMSNGQDVDLTKRFIEEEYELYCGDKSVAHEDDLDCMSRLDDLMPPFGPGLDWYVPENERPERSTRGHGNAGWEAIYTLALMCGGLLAS